MDKFLKYAEEQVNKGLAAHFLIRSYQTSKNHTSLISKALCTVELKGFSDGWSQAVEKAVNEEPELYNGSFNVIVLVRFSFFIVFSPW